MEVSLCRDVRRDRSRKTCEGIRRVRRELLPDVPVLRDRACAATRGFFQRAPFATSLRFWTAFCGWNGAFPPNREQWSVTQSTVYNSRKPDGESSDGSYSTCQRFGDQWSLRDIGACAGKRGPRTVFVRRAFPWRLMTTTFLVPPRAWMKSTSTRERTRAQMYARRRFPNRHRPFRLLA